MMLSDCIQWVALAWAIINRDFADRLNREVGPNAFTDAAADVYDIIVDLQDHKQLRQMFGFPEKGRWSDVVLRHLAKDADELWKHRAGHKTRAEGLLRIINQATEMLEWQAMSLPE